MANSNTVTTTLANLCNAPVRGGASWGNVFGGVLVGLFILQAATGVLLMTVYSPSATTAWSSVWYVQTQIPSGWLIRGLHHFASDAMLVTLLLHGLRIVCTRAYRAPRHTAWWCTLGLAAVTLALSLSGHLLPWDQEGYWGTIVRLNILAKVPLVGAALRRLLIGGSEPGHLTLTRFYTLHVVVLPALAALLIAWRAKTSGSPAGANENAGESEPYCPGQCVRDTVALALIVAGLLGLVWYVRGALGLTLLDAPADPTTADYPARPEWHTLFLYQWLKLFTGAASELIEAIVVPTLIAALLVAFPWIDRDPQRGAGYGVAVGVTAVLLMGAVVLSIVSILADRNPPDEAVATVMQRKAAGESLTRTDEAVLAARRFNDQQQRAEAFARRAIELAGEQGVPPEGPLTLLANDPVTRGPILFAAQCASCHRYEGHNGLGAVPAEPATSSDLAGYARRSWIRGLLADPGAEQYFGRMTKPDGEPAHTRMSKWVRETMGDNEEEADRRKLLDNFDAVAAYLEDESRHPGRLAEDTTPASEFEGDEAFIRRGRAFFRRTCNECHSYQGEREGTLKAPEMFGYGSVEWIAGMIADPSHDTRYRSQGREPAQMPAFQDRLDERDRRLIAEWLHGSAADDSE